MYSVVNMTGQISYAAQLETRIGGQPLVRHTKDRRHVHDSASCDRCSTRLIAAIGDHMAPGSAGVLIGSNSAYPRRDHKRRSDFARRLPAPCAVERLMRDLGSKSVVPDDYAAWPSRRDLTAMTWSRPRALARYTAASALSISLSKVAWLGAVATPMDTVIGPRSRP